MKYASAAAFRAALEQRLLTTAQQSGMPLARMRKLVVFDRLLARLLVVAEGRWVLKGAVGLNFRLGAQARTTQDLDLARRDGTEATTADFLAAQQRDLGDYFVFAVEIARSGNADDPLLTRYHVRAELAGRLFEEITVDVGFGDPLPEVPERIAGPHLLAFAGIPAIEVPALPLESQIAEKLHAYTRTYAGGRSSSRVKDLIDLVILSETFVFRGGGLRDAIETVFTDRATHALPRTLPRPPQDWRTAWRRMARESRLQTDLAAGYAQASRFLTPILAGTAVNDSTWNPLVGEWQRVQEASGE